jgi:hypothetical protein
MVPPKSQRKGVQEGPTFWDLLTRRGKTPERLSMESGKPPRFSTSLVYRARRGIQPRPLFLEAMAEELGVSPEVCAEAIERSAKKKGAA